MYHSSHQYTDDEQLDHELEVSVNSTGSFISGHSEEFNESRNLHGHEGGAIHCSNDDCFHLDGHRPNEICRDDSSSRIPILRQYEHRSNGRDRNKSAVRCKGPPKFFKSKIPVAASYQHLISKANYSRIPVHQKYLARGRCSTRAKSPIRADGRPKVSRVPLNRISNGSERFTGNRHGLKAKSFTFPIWSSLLENTKNYVKALKCISRMLYPAFCDIDSERDFLGPSEIKVEPMVNFDWGSFLLYVYNLVSVTETLKFLLPSDCDLCNYDRKAAELVGLAETDWLQLLDEMDQVIAASKTIEELVVCAYGLPLRCIIYSFPRISPEVDWGVFFQESTRLVQSSKSVLKYLSIIIFVRDDCEKKEYPDVSVKRSKERDISDFSNNSLPHVSNRNQKKKKCRQKIPTCTTCGKREKYDSKSFAENHKRRAPTSSPMKKPSRFQSLFHAKEKKAQSQISWAASDRCARKNNRQELTSRETKISNGKYKIPYEQSLHKHLDEPSSSIHVIQRLPKMYHPHDCKKDYVAPVRRVSSKTDLFIGKNKHSIRKNQKKAKSSSNYRKLIDSLSNVFSGNVYGYPSNYFVPRYAFSNDNNDKLPPILPKPDKSDDESKETVDSEPSKTGCAIDDSEKDLTQPTTSSFPDIFDDIDGGDSEETMDWYSRRKTIPIVRNKAEVDLQEDSELDDLKKQQNKRQQRKISFAKGTTAEQKPVNPKYNRTSFCRAQSIGANDDRILKSPSINTLEGDWDARRNTIPLVASLNRLNLQDDSSVLNTASKLSLVGNEKESTIFEGDPSWSDHRHTIPLIGDLRKLNLQIPGLISTEESADPISTDSQETTKNCTNKSNNKTL